MLYYIAAFCYKLFGEHEFILRLITLLISTAGFFSLFKLLRLILNDAAYAMLFTFLFISSTVLLYYSNNFLPDASALGFTLSGWLCFYQFLRDRSVTKKVITCFLFFTLGSLLKPTYFINPISAFFTLLLIDFSTLKKIKQALQHNIIPILLFFVSALVVISWNAYAIHYNKVNNDTYFLVHACPIWEMSRRAIDDVMDHMSHYWYSQYYYQSTFHFFIALFIAGLFCTKKFDKTIFTTAVTILPGSLFYWLLFFEKFRYHDYYFIAFLPAILFLTTNAFIAVRAGFPRILNSYLAKIFLCVLCILSLNYARAKHENRYSDKEIKFSKIGDTLASARSLIDSLGIPEHATFIIYTDKTPNGGLYFINHPGWNVEDPAKAGLEKLEQYIRLGADYLVSVEPTDPGFEARYKKIAQQGEVKIYSLKNSRLTSDTFYRTK
jgi:4-amino-4-deoxy-L-arabinose transferase-like glycosyltransferase